MASYLQTAVIPEDGGQVRLEWTRQGKPDSRLDGRRPALEVEDFEGQAKEVEWRQFVYPLADHEVHLLVDLADHGLPAITIRLLEMRELGPGRPTILLLSACIQQAGIPSWSAFPKQWS